MPVQQHVVLQLQLVQLQVVVVQHALFAVVLQQSFVSVVQHEFVVSAMLIVVLWFTWNTHNNRKRRRFFSTDLKKVAGEKPEG